MSDAEPELYEDSKRRYEYVQKIIHHCMADHRSMVIAKEHEVRTRAVSHGALTVEQYEDTLGAMEQNDDVIRWDGLVCWPADDQWVTDVIEWVAENAESKERVQDFVATANRFRDAQ